MKTCSHCGSTMEPYQIFCDKCGYRYVEPPPPPPPPLPQPSPQPPNIKKRKKLGWIIPLILLAVVACMGFRLFSRGFTDLFFLKLTVSVGVGSFIWLFVTLIRFLANYK